jgi:hypothetical protein
VSKSNINILIRMPATFFLSLLCIITLVLMFGLSGSEKDDIKKLFIYLKKNGK